MHNKDTKDQVNPSKIFLFIKTYWQNFARFHCLTAECTENEKNLVRPKKWIDFCVYLFKENMACHLAIFLWITKARAGITLVLFFRTQVKYTSTIKYHLSNKLYFFTTMPARIKSVQVSIWFMLCINFFSWKDKFQTIKKWNKKPEYFLVSPSQLSTHQLCLSC